MNHVSMSKRYTDQVLANFGTGWILSGVTPAGMVRLLACWSVDSYPPYGGMRTDHPEDVPCVPPLAPHRPEPHTLTTSELHEIAVRAAEHAICAYVAFRGGHDVIGWTGPRADAETAVLAETIARELRALDTPCGTCNGAREIVYTGKFPAPLPCPDCNPAIHTTGLPR